VPCWRRRSALGRLRFPHRCGCSRVGMEAAPPPRRLQQAAAPPLAGLSHHRDRMGMARTPRREAAVVGQWQHRLVAVALCTPRLPEHPATQQVATRDQWGNAVPAGGLVRQFRPLRHSAAAAAPHVVVFVCAGARRVAHAPCRASTLPGGGVRRFGGRAAVCHDGVRVIGLHERGASAWAGGRRCGRGAWARIPLVAVCGLPVSLARHHAANVTTSPPPSCRHLSRWLGVRGGRWATRNPPHPPPLPSIRSAAWPPWHYR